MLWTSNEKKTTAEYGTYRRQKLEHFGDIFFSRGGDPVKKYLIFSLLPRKKKVKGLTRCLGQLELTVVETADSEPREKKKSFLAFFI